MGWDDVCELRKAGMDVQSHTRRHQVLQTLTPAQLTDELVGSKRDLETKLNEPVRTLSYPAGREVDDNNEIRMAIEAAGYELGFSCGTGINYNWRSLDRFNVRRVTADRGDSMDMFRSQLATGPIPPSS
jgi:peptidoglycan/xylan/chitin deacetylase (PgdA/CDA1 family)